MTELALVTGGETGIGKAIADALRNAGYEVRSASRRTGFDLQDRAAIARLIESLPRLDVLISNAGIGESAPVHRTNDRMWDDHLALNVTAPFLLCRAALPLLRKASRPRIVQIASTAALQGSPFIAAYVASKHAALGLARALASELEGIQVNSVCPGFVDSPLTDRSVRKIVELTGRTEEQARADLAAQNLCERLIRPDEVAAAVLTLVQGDETGRELVLA
ncbi:MAG: SDR family NAD(P)-dependent oxidoreductase [Planctomycetota bacterium]|jgi:NAD(P)-dependent dehydrogenase (short-subunit alcohol dehydrogenase family)